MTHLACCFTGHRRIQPRDREALTDFLEETIKEAIRRGVDTFITGGALGFDTLAAQAVLQKQRVLSHLRLHLYLPCEGQTKFWHPADVAVYNQIRRYADEVRVIAPFYRDGCMQERNRAMVDASALCIAYLVDAQGGGTRYTVNYAAKKNVPVLLYRRRASL